MNFFKNIGLSLIVFGSITMTSCSNSETSEKPQIEKPTKLDKEEIIDFKNTFIVDVRTTQEFADGHFEGAVNIPVNSIEGYLKDFKGHNQIVVYCRSGARSGKAKRILESNGFDNVINAVNEDNLNKIKAYQKQE